MSLRFAPTKLEPQSLYISLHFPLREINLLSAVKNASDERSVTNFMSQALVKKHTKRAIYALNDLEPRPLVALIWNGPA